LDLLAGFGVFSELLLRLRGLVGQLVEGFVAFFSTHLYRLPMIEILYA
jgi:hypothetical protein